MHHNWKSLLKTLKTMLDKHKHSFSTADLNLLIDKRKEIEFYKSVFKQGKIPKSILTVLELEKVDTLYYLSTMLDKYSLENNDLQKLIMQFEKIKILISN
jgi:Asp-tRNA(Asn)/Glu-tRNA(Gln) amidotransferase B subunit